LQRLAQWDNPGRGDMVVFFSPHEGTRLVKRVIALPGDTLEMRNNVLLLNGQPMNYELLSSQPFSEEIYEDARAVIARERGDDSSHLVMALPSRDAMRSFTSITVPEGKYFAIGDSRCARCGRASRPVLNTPSTMTRRSSSASRCGR
jgi:signal peptidase I